MIWILVEMRHGHAGELESAVAAVVVVAVAAVWSAWFPVPLPALLGGPPPLRPVAVHYCFCESSFSFGLPPPPHSSCWRVQTRSELARSSSRR